MADKYSSNAGSLYEFAQRRSISYMKVKRVQEELVCAICLDFLEEPKLLHCAHSFCRKCLVDLVVLLEVAADEVSEGRIQCPSCRDYTSVLGGDLNSLRTNFKLASMVAIVSEEHKAQVREALKGRMSRPVQTWQLPVCSQHLRPQEYYCSECLELLCRKCMISGHRSHNYDEAEEVLWSRVNSLRSLVQPAWEAAARAEDLEKGIAPQRDSVTANSVEVTNEVKAFFEQARQLLNQREGEVLQAVEEHASKRTEKLTTWEEKLGGDREGILDTISEIDTLVECTGDVSVITKTNAIVETLNLHQRSILNISESLSQQGRSSTRSLLTFSPKQTLDVPISKLGVLKQQVFRGAESMQEVPLGVGREDLAERRERLVSQTSNGEPTSLTPRAGTPETEHIFPSTGQPSKLSTLPAERDTVLPLSPTPSSLQRSTIHRRSPVHRQGAAQHRELILSYSTPNLSLIKNHGQPGSINVSRAATTLPTERKRRGMSHCEVNTKRADPPGRKNSEPILPGLQAGYQGQLPHSKEHEDPETASVTSTGSTGSRSGVNLLDSVEEYCPHVEQPIMVFPQQTVGHSTEIQPVGVAIGQGNSIVICDLHSNTLKVVACSGRLIDTLGSQGKVTGQFRKPSAVTIDPDGTIFVADNGNSRIQKFSTGKFSTKFWQKTKGSNMGDFWGIAVSPDQKIYASDWLNHCVHAFDRHGKHINRLGADFLKLPVGIALNTFGHLLIADREYHCIWVLSPEGLMLKQIGHQGKGAGQLSYPYGIAVHQDGLILVTETGNSRVSIFSQTGDFITCFGGKGSEPGRFDHPKHICVNSRGQIVIADELNHRIQVFDITQLLTDVQSKHVDEWHFI